MPYDVTRKFESEVAAYAGAKYGVAVESGTAAIFLSLYRRWWERGGIEEVEIPARTYPSVACSIIHWGGRPIFIQDGWLDGSVYVLKPLDIVDGALSFRRGMYRGGLHCLSFHVKKLLPIGRGGMILTDDEETYRWLKKARFDGRDECDLNRDSFSMLGFNMYMTPEQAARGLQLFSIIRNSTKDPADLVVSEQGYPDLSQYEVYRR